MADALGFVPRRTLFYPKQGKNEFYQALLTQCRNLKIPEVDTDFEAALASSDVAMDAIFGFSFSGQVRAPFDNVIDALKRTDKPIVSVDIPSAWDVEAGDPDGKYFTPAVLISLTAPKLGSKAFKGRHYLGGRFVPP
jgi:NAD(P)H-hydrate epimerase